MKVKKIVTILALVVSLSASSVSVMAEASPLLAGQEIMPRAHVEDVLVSYDVVWENGRAYASWRENETYRRITYVNSFSYSEEEKDATTWNDRILGWQRRHYVRTYKVR